MSSQFYGRARLKWTLGSGQSPCGVLLNQLPDRRAAAIPVQVYNDCSGGARTAHHRLLAINVQRVSGKYASSNTLQTSPYGIFPLSHLSPCLCWQYACCVVWSRCLHGHVGKNHKHFGFLVDITVRDGNLLDGVRVHTPSNFRPLDQVAGNCATRSHRFGVRAHQSKQFFSLAVNGAALRRQTAETSLRHTNDCQSSDQGRTRGSAPGAGQRRVQKVADTPGAAGVGAAGPRHQRVVRELQTDMERISRQRKILKEETGHMTRPGPCVGCDADVCCCSAANHGSRLEKELQRVERNVEKLQVGKKHFTEQDLHRPGTCHCFQDVDSQPQAPPVSKQLRDLQEESHMLRESFRAKVDEVSQLMIENKMLKEAVASAQDEKTQAEMKFIAIKMRLKEFENNASATPRTRDLKRDLESNLKEVTDQEQRVNLLPRQATETMKYQELQLKELRKKYLELQRALEEQTQEAQSLRSNNQHVQGDIGMRIHYIKSEYQREMKMLAPMAAELERTNASLQEEMREKMELHNKCTELTRHLRVSEKRAMNLVNQLDASLSKQSQKEQSSAGDMECTVTRLKQENEEMEKLVAILRNQLAEKSDKLAAAEHHVQQLSEKLTMLREESLRQVAEVRRQAGRTTRMLHGKTLEAEAAAQRTRVVVYAALKDRDLLSQHMQSQVIVVHRAARLVLRAPSRTVDFTRRVSRPLVRSRHKHPVRRRLAFSRRRPSSLRWEECGGELTCVVTPLRHPPPLAALNYVIRVAALKKYKTLALKNFWICPFKRRFKNTKTESKDSCVASNFLVESNYYNNLGRLQHIFNDWLDVLNSLYPFNTDEIKLRIRIIQTETRQNAVRNE
ncbi:hypothetical protein PR048_004190 [Dryococelus australis]|uniref:Centrosomal protein of 162 kDa n=1 Tax=Dryococelus australis TaxID=614101 RepID=A0ABQ9I4S5_9NEOP|nr:hypothetical protein PR048_004190 [Dryococelus australis]